MSYALPKSILFLTCFSLLLATCILILSLLNLGRHSLWMNSTCAVFTLAYHATLFILAHVHPDKTSMFFVTSIVCAYMLSVAWLASFAVMAILACGKPILLHLSGITIATVAETYPPTLHTFECILTPFECIIMADLAVRLSVQRRKAKASMGCKRANGLEIPSEPSDEPRITPVAQV